MAGQSKHVDNDAREHKKMLATLATATSLNVFTWFIMIPARPALISRAYNNDMGKTATTMASMTSAASLMEFLLTPTLGALSDKLGRRPVMLASAAVAAVARMGTFLMGDNPDLVVLGNVLDRAFSGSAFPLFLTTAYASAADLARKTGDASLLNKHQSRAHAIIGLALVLAPPLGAMIMSKTGNAKYPALAAVCVSIAHFVYMYKNLKETHHPEADADAKKGPEGKKLNPFSFLRFFSGDRRTATMAFAYLLFSLPVEMHDVRMTLLRKYGLTDAETAKVLALLGFGTVVGGVMTAKSIQTLGATGHTATSALMACAFHMLWGRAQDYSSVLSAIPFSTLGGTLSVPLKTALTQNAMASGMQPGQISGALSNLTNATKVVMPQVYGQLFVKYGQQAPFVFASLMSLAGLYVFYTKCGLNNGKAKND
eukprot:g2760.t1